jgi:hypothetical protein
MNYHNIIERLLNELRENHQLTPAQRRAGYLQLIEITNEYLQSQQPHPQKHLK